MVRNIILASLISTFAMFGALGTKDTKTELTCLAIAFVVWALCIWRCVIINRRINERHEGQRMFNEYMRRNVRNQNRY
jgi:hypothetical protein